MRCPRCQSERIQRDHNDAVFFIRMFGLHKLLCNNCGLVFKAFDPLKAHQSAPAEDAKEFRNRRRAPRYYAHLPTAIALVEGQPEPGKVRYSQPSRGHCDRISAYGMGLSLVGARLPEAELSRVGRLLFVRIDLPEGPVETIVAIVTANRAGEDGKKKWALGVKIHRMTDENRQRLASYLDKRAKEEPVIASD